MRLAASSCLLLLLNLLPTTATEPAATTKPRTAVSIEQDRFLINGKLTYAGQTWQGHKVEGLLMNSRMVQGIFDDLNPATSKQWAYADTGRWDANRNTDEFVAAMPSWRQHGLLAFTINLQGGSPEGYSKDQPWHNSSIADDGSLRTDYLARLAKIIRAADEQGMIVILGYFYFGQDQRLKDEAAVIKAVDAATEWVLQNGWTNVMIEINNECNVRYDHKNLQPAGVHELIQRVQQKQLGGRRLLVSTSYGGGTVPQQNVVRVADFLLLHGNGIKDPDQVTKLVEKTRQVAGYTPKPILFNEDDHFDFDQPKNNMTSAVAAGASWGYFDFRMKNEAFRDGYQSVPVDWTINSPRKIAFFKKLAEITGSK